ncbi:mitogen-activated protein kinase-binding protein 1 isoform X3 [Erpetoichthys calabaricus]|uniref:mitogen-activated protein kinase-binding protein 1 isoform X3 n=1 Tax=Erpetoichthys calabaricus TaxID=27687 RepID=UPI002234C367|nr:mitogen-activated protein kinase-binding protein 1 isoform X3 [Erpetoichthys calabaricus]
MTTESSTIKSRIKNLLRSPSIKLRRNKAATGKENLGSKVTLEKVLGITTSGSSGLACDPRSGLVAYPAGCVVVLLNLKKTKQHHILNSSRKTITALAFSPDGKYLVTGESGHMPAVRVWDVAERAQVSELQEHKYGVACVAFSPNGKYIVSVGYQHDMIVNVWSWKKNVVVAANKVSSKVTAVSFSEDSSYFVTVGNRHVKFWYLEHAKSSKVTSTVPLQGRSGLLGELRNNFFSDVACGRGRKAGSTFCITSSGLLCEFNDKRLLDKWVELRTSMATSLSVSEELIFCGCADGTVRAFNPVNLHFICTLPRPHRLGVDIATVTDASHLFCTQADARFPDVLAVTYDSTNRWLSCIYNDHSLYAWDVRDPRKVGKVYSALYHAACVWSIEVYPELPDSSQSRLPPGSILTCSADNTVRLWDLDNHSTMLTRNVISNDLLKIIYMDNNTSFLLDTECNAGSASEKAESQTADIKAGIRTLCIRPDGQHLASGDRTGILRVHDLKTMEEILKVEAHDSEILCLEYSKPDTGLNLLATASRDRLIHVLDAGNEYSLLQTLDEHSSSITAVKFAANEGKVRMISCGADKSIYFRTAQKNIEGTEFTRTHHIVRKTTLYDMDVDPTCKYAAIGCQDRSIRIFNLSSGKQKKLYKGSQGEDGTLIKVQTDPSGLYIATSCSDKNISIFDFYSGECVATMFGHSEIVTGMKFTNDCKHLVSVSGDSCIFIWRLNPELTINMRQRLSELKQKSKASQKMSPRRHSAFRQEIYNMPPTVTMSSDSDKEAEDDILEEDESLEKGLPYISNSDKLEESGLIEENQDTWTVHPWGQKKGPLLGDTRHSEELVIEDPPRQRRRWSHRMGGMQLTVKSMLDLRQLDSLALSQSKHQQDIGSSTISLQALVSEMSKPTVSCPQKYPRPHTIQLTPYGDGGVDLPSPDREGPVLYPECMEDTVSLSGSEYQVKELPLGKLGRAYHCHDKHSPDSACSMDYSSSRLSSPDRPKEDSEVTEPLSMDGNSSELEGEELEEEDEEQEDCEGSLTEGVVPSTPDQETFLKQHFETLDCQSSAEGQSKTMCGTESVSISSRFLSQTSSNRSTPFPSPTKGANTTGSPPVSEVRPIMEDELKKPKESCLAEITTVQPLEKPQAARLPFALRKRNPISETRRSTGTAGKPSGYSTGGQSIAVAQCIRKAQSVHDLVMGADQTMSATIAVKEVQSVAGQSSEKEGKPSQRRAMGAGPTSPQFRDGSRTAKTRSYMNPTTSSMAKMSRSVSMGDNLNLTESEETLSMPSNENGSDLRRASVDTLNGTCKTIPSDKPKQTVVLSCPIISLPKVAVTPTISASLNPQKNLQTKLPSSGNGKPHLSLDIGQPLPDKPSFASFSPSSKGKMFIEEMEAPSVSPQGKQTSVFEELVHKNQEEQSTTSHSAAGKTELPSEEFFEAHKDTSTQELIPRPPYPLPSLDTGLSRRMPSFTLLSACMAPHCLAVPLLFFSSSFWPVSSAVHCFLCSSIVRSSLLAASAVSVENCRLVATDLQRSLHRAMSLYRTVRSNSRESSPEKQEIVEILSQTFSAMRTELDSVDEPPQINHRALQDGERTLALLEQYSELLLQAVERRLDHKS